MSNLSISSRDNSHSRSQSLAPSVNSNMGGNGSNTGVIGGRPSSPRKKKDINNAHHHSIQRPVVIFPS